MMIDGGSGQPTSAASPAAAHGAPAVAADDAAAVATVRATAAASLAAIEAAFAEVRTMPLWALGESELLDLARGIETAVCSGFGAQVRIAGEIAERGVAATLSVRSAAQLLRETLRITIVDARGRIAAAATCLPSETPTGQVVDAPLPQLLDAIDAGNVSARHAAVISACWRKLPADLDSETRVLCRDLLLSEATRRDPDGLRQVAENIHAIIDPDGNAPKDDAADRAELHIGVRRGDGLTPIRGLLDPLIAEQLRVAVEALAAPRPIDDRTPDPRPAALRRAQALGEIVHRHLIMGAGPTDGGVRPQVVVTIPLADLIDKLGPAWSDYDGVQTPALARMLACDARIIPQVLSSQSVVLDQGRAVRLFTPAQRRALITRDRGCAFPGCDIPPAWVDAHHITEWQHQGPTDTTNAVLLCRRHHTTIHQGHWSIALAPDGKPDFRPPAYIDPTRKPRRNNHFHPPRPTAVVRR